MATVFCSHCGYVIARGAGGDSKQAARDYSQSACPRCGRTGIGWCADDDVPEDEILISVHGLREFRRGSGPKGNGRRVALILLVAVLAVAGYFYLMP